MQRLSEILLGASDHRNNGAAHQIRFRRGAIGIKFSDSVKNIADADMFGLARQLITAARTARAFQDAVVDERLKHRLQMAGREVMALGQTFCGDGPVVSMQGDIDDSPDCEKALSG